MLFLYNYIYYICLKHYIIVIITTGRYIMKLQNLDNYKENFSDEIIFNNLIKSSDKDLIEYTINVTSDLLNGVFLTDEFKANAKANLKN